MAQVSKKSADLNVIEGPSKFDLMEALFHGQYYDVDRCLAYFTFKEIQHGAQFIVESVGRPKNADERFQTFDECDGVWIIKMRVASGSLYTKSGERILNSTLHGWYSVKTRKGEFGAAE